MPAYHMLGQAARETRRCNGLAMRV